MTKMMLVTGNLTRIPADFIRGYPRIFNPRKSAFKIFFKRFLLNKGLTFLEILLVIVIIGNLAAMTLPNFKRTFNNLQLHGSSQQLQSFMNYLSQRAIVERKIICLEIDSDKQVYWAKIKDAQTRLKSYALPKEIEIESGQKEILFYPDGSIDKVSIKLINPDNENITLTTEGVFGGVKLLP